ncbi:Glycosyl transferase, group 1 [Candidatus Saccharibacteria bacterium RAAC3_TM7_1]|nr:Glycosyl transferase, group 1 [Candidatus Saccharibacteria bacterium RAAC3_TM7_1]HCZ28611.1 glycosyltransferase family 4 protein [Candidatus Saccharibacteria bacterium]
MKILIAADLHWPTINGVATFSRNLAKGLADRGHEVIVIAPSQTGGSYEEWDGNYLIKRTMSVPFPFYQNFRISLTPQREIKKIFQEFQPDLVHLQMCLTIGNVAQRYALKYGIPIVATNHAIPDNLLDNLRYLAPMSRPISYVITEYGVRFHAKVDYVTLPTQSAIEMFGEERIVVPVEAVSNGIDLSKFTPTKPTDAIYEKFKIPRDKRILAYVGRTDAEKHIPVLVEAYKIARESLKTPSHLLIVGAGTDLERLKNIVYENDLHDHVTFTGRVSDEEIVELHKVGDVFAMPSPAELQCIAMLEAMASGKPVIAVDAGPLKELCQPERNGLLSEKDNPADMAKNIVTLLDDPAKRKAYSKESLAIAKTHDLQHTIDKFEEIYQTVMKLPKTRRLPQPLL